MRRQFLKYLVASLLLTACLPSVGLDLYLTEVAPYAYAVDGKGGYDGINVRIARELEKRTGVPLELKIVPSARHIALFRSAGEAYSISQVDNFSDADGVSLSEVAQYPVVVVAARGTVLNTYEDLITLSATKGIGMMRHLSYAPVGHDARIRKVEINSIENGLRMLAAGRISAIVGSEPALLVSANKNGQMELLGNMLVINHAAQVLRVRPAYADSPSSHLLTDALLAMRKDGTVPRMVSEFQQGKTGSVHPAVPASSIP